MTLDAEQQLQTIWSYWMHEAKNASEEPSVSGLFVDERNPNRNSVMDAEALMCFLLPQSTVDIFDLRDGQSTRGIAVDVINDIFRGNKTDKNQKLEAPAIEAIVEISRDFLETNRLRDRPTFYGGSYLDATEECPTEFADGNIPIVDSYTMSITTCLQLINLGGQSAWGNKKNGKQISSTCDDIVKLAKDRLEAALEGLCRTFCHNEISTATWKDNTLIPWPGHEDSLTKIQVRLAELGFESSENMAFECGWSWGNHYGIQSLPGESDPLTDEASDDEDEDEPRLAIPEPYLYFTLNTIDGIEDLFDEWVQTEEILSPRQLMLAARLRNLADLSARYWATIAYSPSIFNPDTWALEVLPWRTADGEASIQWSLYVFGLLLRDIITRKRSTTPHELGRLVDVLEELSQQARLTRPPVNIPISDSFKEKVPRGDYHDATRDPGLSLHWPGTQLALNGVNDTTYYTLPIYDFAPQLLKRAALLLGNTSEPEIRHRLRSLIDSVWDLHIRKRSRNALRDQQGHRTDHNFWDFPSNPYADFAPYSKVTVYKAKRLKDDIDGPVTNDEGCNATKDDGDGYVESEKSIQNTTVRVSSWYITQRVVEALVTLSKAPGGRQHLRLNTLELVVRELSDQLLNDLDSRLYGASTDDRRDLEQLRIRALDVGALHGKGQLTFALRELLDISDKMGSS